MPENPGSVDGYHLLHISGGTEPSLVGEPFASYDEMLVAARAFWNDRDECKQEYDGLFYVHVAAGELTVGSFVGDELDPEGESDDES